MLNFFFRPFGMNSYSLARITTNQSLTEGQDF